MKRNLKLIMLFGSIVATIIISCKSQFATTKTSYTAVASPAAFERGKVLAYSICGGCHYNRSVNKFIGTQIEDIPSIAGKVYSANLTHSKAHGIAPEYSDAEIRHLLKTGVAKDGRFLSYMLRPNMADEDINAIIVYLRSDDPAVSAADTTVGLTHLTFIGKTFMNLNAKPAPYRANVKLPVASDKIATGYYLVDNLGCFHCHSKNLTKLNFEYPDKTKGYLAGGIKLKGMNGIEIKASNITPDKLTGIGNYTQEQFRKALIAGQAPYRKLKPPMPKFTMLKESEIDAIYAYLQTVPAKYNIVKNF